MRARCESDLSPGTEIEPDSAADARADAGRIADVEVIEEPEAIG